MGNKTWDLGNQATRSAMCVEGLESENSQKALNTHKSGSEISCPHRTWAVTRACGWDAVTMQIWSERHWPKLQRRNWLMGRWQQPVHKRELMGCGEYFCSSSRIGLRTDVTIISLITLPQKKDCCKRNLLMRSLKYLVLPRRRRMRKSYRKHQIVSVMGVRERGWLSTGRTNLMLPLLVNKKKKKVLNNGVSILTQIHKNTDPTKLLAPQSKGRDQKS